MSYMKLVAQMSNDRQTTDLSLRGIKAALLTAQSNNLNYVIYQGEYWTIPQIQGIIALLDKKLKEYDTLRRSKESSSSK